MSVIEIEVRLGNKAKKSAAFRKARHMGFVKGLRVHQKDKGENGFAIFGTADDGLTEGDLRGMASKLLPYGVSRMNIDYADHANKSFARLWIEEGDYGILSLPNEYFPEPSEYCDFYSFKVKLESACAEHGIETTGKVEELRQEV